MSQIKAAYNWVKGFSLSSIKSIEILRSLTIRKLKAVASKMNRELGQVICKATFSKCLSNMRKQELIDAVWFVRSVQLAAPKGKFDLRQLTQRIFTMLCDGEAHVYYFGFSHDVNGTSVQNANRFQKYLATKGLCTLSSIRKVDRLKGYEFEFEVKVWGINEDTLLKLLTKDKPIVVSSVAVGDRFVVTDDAYGWTGHSGKVVSDKGKSVLAEMDESSGGKATFTKEQIKAEGEMTIEQWVNTCQKMYDVCREGGIAKIEMIKFAERRGLEVVNGKVGVRF